MKRLIVAEWRVLMRRGAARGLLLVSALIPVLTTALIGWAAHSQIVWNGEPIADTLRFSGPHAAALSLRARHAIFLPMFILFVTGTSLAEERSNHMLRERLVRAVSRDTLLLAKLMSLILLCIASLLLNLVLSLSIGTVWMGTDGPWSLVLLGHLLSVCTDLGLIALGLFLSTLFRSGAMVVVSGLMVYFIDKGAGLALFVLGMVGIQINSAVPMLLPSAGWNLWSAMMGDPILWAGLNWLVWTLGLLLLTRVRLARMDIP